MHFISSCHLFFLEDLACIEGLCNTHIVKDAPTPQFIYRIMP